MSWLIYKHTNRINGKVYIGQSKYTWKKINDRWQSGRGYGISTRIGLAIKKYGWENFSHDLIEEGIETQELANEREIYWIREYNSYAEGYNSTFGGKSVSNELCFKLKVYCLETNESYESVMDASHKLNISYYFIQRQLTTGHYYPKDKYKFCLESEKDSFNPVFYEIKYDFTSIKKNVICVETNEIFDSITECSMKTGITTQNLSQNCCKNHRKAKGKHYAYLEEYDEDWIPAKEYNTSRRKEASSLKKEIFCFQTQKFYSSSTEAAEELNIPIRSIARCAKKNGDLIQTHGYSFCYKEDWFEGWAPRDKKQGAHLCSEESKIKMRKNSGNSKKVICLETGDIFISASEAGRVLGISKDSIIRVCNNKPHCKTAGGYHWKFINNKLENEEYNY